MAQTKPDQLVKLAMSALQPAPDGRSTFFDPERFTALRRELESVPGGPEFHEAIAALALFARFLDESQNARPLALELLLMLEQVGAPEARRLRAARDESTAAKLEAIAEKSSELLDPKGEALPDSGERVNVLTVPRNIRG